MGNHLREKFEAQKAEIEAAKNKPAEVDQAATTSPAAEPVKAPRKPRAAKKS